MTFTSFALYGCMGAVMYYAAVLKIDGKITVGDITAFLLFMIQLIANFVIVSLVIGNVSKMVGASEKIITLMQYMPKIHTNGGKTISEQEVVGEVELRNIEFSYPTKPDVKVCKGISLKIAKNKVVALVGESGCGKSSLISLIQRFYDPSEGQVLFSGVDIRCLDPRWYKQQLSIVA